MGHANLIKHYRRQLRIIIIIIIIIITIIMRLTSTYQHFRIYMNYNVVTLNFKTENNSKNRIYKYVIIFKLRNLLMM